MTEYKPAGSAPPEEEPALSGQEQPDTSQPAQDPGYLTETGEPVAEDGSVAPIIGGLPAVEARPGTSAPLRTSAALAWLTSRPAERTRTDLILRLPSSGG